MPLFDPAWLFAILGPLFLALGLARALATRRLRPQVLPWLLLGVIFTAVALWLWMVRGAPAG